MEDSQGFDQQIEAAYQRLHELTERSGRSPEQESAIGACLEELRLAGQELRWQNEAALEALRNSEERFRTLAAFAPVGIYLTDARGDCQYVNERWCEMAGLSPEEAMGQGWVKGLAEEDRERVASAWYEMTESQGHWGLEYRFRTPAGKTTWVFGHAARLLDGRGQLAGYVGTNVDITELKQATSQREAALAERERLLAELNAANVELKARNEELQAQAEELEVQAEELRCQADELNSQALKLQKEQARLRAIINSAPEAILVADERGQIVLDNPAAEHLFAVPVPGAAGQEHYAEVTRYHPDHTPAGRRNLALFRAATHRETCCDEPQALLWPDGQWRDILASAAPIVDEHGQSHGAVAVYQDITGRLQAEAEREHLLAQTRQDRESIAILAQTLERERDTLQTIMESTHTHLAYLDPDFNFVRVNLAYIQGSGHSREEIIGRNHFDLFPDAENQAIFEQTRDSGRKVIFHAKPFEYADQPERGISYWDWTLVPVKKEGEDQVRGLVLSLLDVTQQVRAEQERERHMARLDTLIRVSQEILAERTAGGLLQQIVDAARKLTAARIGVAGHGYRNGTFEVGAAARAEDLAACPPEAVCTIQQGGVYLELMKRAASIRLTDEQLRARPAWWGLPDGHAPLRGLLGARLVGSDGQAVGLIMVSDKEQGDFTAEDEALLAQLAAVASLALQHIQARSEAEQRADEMNAVFTSINEAVIVFDANGRVVRANPAANAVYGAELAGTDRATVTQKLFLRHPDGRPVMAHELAVARALRGEQVHGKRFILTSADGRDVNILTSAAPLLADGRLVGSVVVWHDITERERLLADLAAERARLKAIIDNAPEAIIVTDSASRIVLANPAAEQLYGRPLPYGEDFNDQAALALCSPDGTPCAPRDLPLARSALDGETITSLDMAIAWSDGRRRDLLVSSAPIRDDAGRTRGAVGIFQDITQRKQAEEQLKAALAENEVLMREIYHRVKNNIQTLISLMDMQAESIADPDSRTMIHELQARARTMALVHEQLYQSGNLAQIDFGTYLNDLIANLSRAFGADRPIIWDIDAADVLLGVDIAIPCGLIVNELLTNAMKYAFPNARPIVERGETECKIRVEFRAEGNRFTLVAADNGVGLPPGLDWSTTKSLGLQLINVLACHQLGGQVEVDTQAGTTFKITFTERKKKRK